MSLNGADPVYLTGNPGAIDKFIDAYDTFLIDCDGVAWEDRKLFPGAADALNMLKRKGKQVLFVTNSSSIARSQMLAIFEAGGFKSSVSDMYTSPYSAALYISHVLDLPPDKKRVFLIGNPTMEGELKAAGIPFCGGMDDLLHSIVDTQALEDISSGEALYDDVGTVLVGWDDRPSYRKYSLAFAYLQRGAKFLLSHPDKCTVYGKNKMKFLGCGSMCAPLISGSGITPLTLGKPSALMMDAIEANVTLVRSRTCMVGDNLETDIRFGIDSGLGGTLTVLTGVADKEDFLKKDARIVPTAYLDRMADLTAAKS